MKQFDEQMQNIQPWKLEFWKIKVLEPRLKASSCDGVPPSRKFRKDVLCSKSRNYGNADVLQSNIPKKATLTPIYTDVMLD